MGYRGNPHITVGNADQNQMEHEAHKDRCWIVAKLLVKEHDDKRSLNGKEDKDWSGLCVDEISRNDIAYQVRSTCHPLDDEKDNGTRRRLNERTGSRLISRLLREESEHLIT